MKIIFSILIIFVSSGVFSKENQTDTLVKAIQNLCVHPSGKGSFWAIEANADAGANIKLLGSLTGNIKLNKEEWDGVRRVLPKDQVSDSNKYRDCVMQVTPVFIQKFQVNNEKSEPANSLGKCNQDQYDEYEYYSEKASKKIVDALGGGQDIRVDISDCRYNSFSKMYTLDTEIYWSGLFLKNNKYNVDGELKMKINGADAVFSEKYASKKVKDLRFWSSVAKGIYYLGKLEQE